MKENNYGKELIVFDLEEKLVETNRVTIYEDALEFNNEENEIETITDEKTDLTQLTTVQEENEMKQQEQENYRRLQLMNEDIDNIKPVDYFGSNFRHFKTKQFGIKDNYLTSLIELQNFQADFDSIWVAKFSFDEKYLATGGRSGVLKIWEVLTYEDSIGLYEPKCVQSFLNFFNETALRVYTEHKKDIIDLAWSEHNKNRLVTVSIDYTAILWDINKDSSLQIYKHNDIVSSVSFYPNVPLHIYEVTDEDDVFITGCFDHIVRIWGKNNNEPVKIIHVVELITAVSFFPEANFLIAGSSEGKLSIYECVENLRYSYSFNCKNKKGKYSNGRKITGIYFINRNEAVITTNDSRIRIVNAFNGTVIQKYKGHSNEESLIRAGYDEIYSMISCASDNGYIYLWNTDITNPFKNRTNESYRPFINKKELPTGSHFISDKCLKEYNKKIHKLNDMIHLNNIMVNTSTKGSIQIVLNYKVIKE